MATLPGSEDILKKKSAQEMHFKHKTSTFVFLHPTNYTLMMKLHIFLFLIIQPFK